MDPQKVKALATSGGVTITGILFYLFTTLMAENKLLRERDVDLIGRIVALETKDGFYHGRSAAAETVAKVAADDAKEMLAGAPKK